MTDYVILTTKYGFGLFDAAHPELGAIYEHQSEQVLRRRSRRLRVISTAAFMRRAA